MGFCTVMGTHNINDFGECMAQVWPERISGNEDIYDKVEFLELLMSYEKATVSELIKHAILENTLNVEKNI